MRGQEPAKKARKRLPLSQRQKQQQKPKTSCKPFNLHFRPICFNILPSYLFHANILRHLRFMSYSIPQQVQYVLQVSRSPYKYRVPFVAFNNGNFWSIQDSKPLIDAINVIRRSRFLFRILLHHWRSRKLITVNTDDVATLETPKKAIFVVDWQTKKKYQYEATTLMRDMTERLLNHDGFFDTSQEPRNPLTNNPLTQAQTLSIWNQISYAGIPVSTAFTAYRQCHWNLERFIREYSKNLQLHAFRRTMQNTRHGDCIERLLDFIDYVYDQEDCIYNRFAYKYVLSKFPDNDTIKSWASFCTRYYEASIIYQNRDQALVIQDAVIEGALKLLYKQDSIIQIYNIHRRYLLTQAQIQIVGEA